MLRFQRTTVLYLKFDFLKIFWKMVMLDHDNSRDFLRELKLKL